MKLDFTSHGGAIDQRLHQRVKSKLKAVIGTDEGKIHQCAICDLSLSGARMESDHLFEAQSDLWVLLRVPYCMAIEHILVRCRIVRQVRAEGDCVVYGLEFDDLPEQGQVVIDEYLSSIEQEAVLCKG